MEKSAITSSTYFVYSGKYSNLKMGVKGTLIHIIIFPNSLDSNFILVYPTIPQSP
jgi:hypothetical protein